MTYSEHVHKNRRDESFVTRGSSPGLPGMHGGGFSLTSSHQPEVAPNETQVACGAGTPPSRGEFCAAGEL